MILTLLLLAALACEPDADYVMCPLPAPASPTPSYAWIPHSWEDRHAVVGVVLITIATDFGTMQSVELPCEWITIERPDRTIVRWVCPGIVEGEPCLNMKPGIPLQRHFDWPAGTKIQVATRLRYEGSGERLSSTTVRNLCWPRTVTVVGRQRSCNWSPGLDERVCFADP